MSDLKFSILLMRMNLTLHLHYVTLHAFGLIMTVHININSSFCVKFFFSLPIKRYVFVYISNTGITFNYIIISLLQYVTLINNFHFTDHQ